MKRAIIQGENHLNPKDAKRLLEDSDQAEILYVEGRNNEDVFSYWPPSYLLYFVGTLLISLFYRSASLIKENTNIFFDEKREARRRGLEVYSDIDLTLKEMYDEVSTRARYRYLSVTTVYSFYPVALLLNYIENPIPSIPMELVGLFFLLTVPFVYFALIICRVLPRSDIRNQKMAESITEQTEKRGYDSVLVLVGDAHVPVVASHLRDLGWAVNDRQSSDSTMKAWRILSSILPGWLSTR